MLLRSKLRQSLRYKKRKGRGNIRGFSFLYHAGIYTYDVGRLCRLILWSFLLSLSHSDSNKRKPTRAPSSRNKITPCSTQQQRHAAAEQKRRAAAGQKPRASRGGHRRTRRPKRGTRPARSPTGIATHRERYRGGAPPQGGNGTPRGRAHHTGARRVWAGEFPTERAANSDGEGVRAVAQVAASAWVESAAPRSG